MVTIEKAVRRLRYKAREARRAAIGVSCAEAMLGPWMTDRMDEEQEKEE